MRARTTLTLALAGATVIGLACSSPDGRPGAAPSGAPSTSSSSASVVSAGPPAPSREGGTLSRAPADDALFLADEDHTSIRVAALPLDEASAIETTAVPGRPGQVLATGNRVLVSIREMPDGTGALLVMDRQGPLGLVEKARIPLPPDAWGIALSPDESLAMVSSAWAAKVSVIDLASAKVLSTIDVAREPRGITILPGGDTAYVSHLVGSGVTRIDKLRDASPSVRRVELPASPSRSPLQTKLPASLGYTVLTSPDGSRVFFPRQAIGAIGKAAWAGTAAVDVIVASTGAPFAAPRQGGGSTFIEPLVQGLGQVPWWDASSDVLETGNASFVQPRAAIYRKSQRTLLVASEGTNAVVELDALMSDPTFGPIRSYAVSRGDDPNVGGATKGGAPTGLALSADEKMLYVHCRSTDDLVKLELPRGEGAYAMAPLLYRHLVDDKPTHEEAAGRALFYDARDAITSGGMACAGCHPEGRDDGHVWHEVAFDSKVTNFFGSATDAVFLVDRWKDQGAGKPINADLPGSVGNARQTPMIVGRVKAAGPYGWLGESKDLTQRLVGGFGLHRWNSNSPTDGEKLARAAYLARFIREKLVAPPREKRPLTDEERKGKAIFTSEKAACATCHTPDSDYTNRSLASFGESPPLPGFFAEKGVAYKTPSLLFVGGSAPYFHDGRYDSLEEIIDKNADRMGKTAHLSAEEKKALVAFLKTL